MTQRQRFDTRAADEPWNIANKYMGWFAVECHYTPDQVFDMPWVQLVTLSLLADDMADARSNQNNQQAMSGRQPRRMT